MDGLLILLFQLFIICSIVIKCGSKKHKPEPASPNGDNKDSNSKVTNSTAPPTKTSGEPIGPMAATTDPNYQTMANVNADVFGANKKQEKPAAAPAAAAPPPIAPTAAGGVPAEPNYQPLA